jgi:hypothetical protein
MTDFWNILATTTNQRQDRRDDILDLLGLNDAPMPDFASYVELAPAATRFALMSDEFAGDEFSSLPVALVAAESGPPGWDSVHLAIAQHSVHKVEPIEGTNDEEFVVSNLRKFKLEVVLKLRDEPVDNRLELRVRLVPPPPVAPSPPRAHTARASQGL